MPIVVVFDFPGEDTAKYHKVFELGGPAVNAQPERLDHICYETDDGFTVIDVSRRSQLHRIRRRHWARPRGSRPEPPAGHPPARRHHGKGRQSRHVLTTPSAGSLASCR